MIAAGSNNAFAINGFTGLTNPSIVSFFFVFLIFNFYVVLTATALASFFVTAKPRHGVVRTAALWHFAAVILLLLSYVTTVWGAPAEKAFVNPAGNALTVVQPANITVFGLGIGRADMMLIGLVIAVLAANLILIGFVQGIRQRRVLRERALVTA
ncbi:MAG: hypothetical protein ACREN2_06395 [Candidatus Dormibacteria bacterium]